MWGRSYARLAGKLVLGKRRRLMNIEKILISILTLHMFKTLAVFFLGCLVLGEKGQNRKAEAKEVAND